ncbi:YicC/YloC family endoribonuclease [Methylococcus sp. EFPC2]|uniref:YicC/YloC family endoribonuclease n=1 Tax=Methylococcus sp. EFPC2 TaxID=2812648 RepID=UPI001F083DC1|nr:YicC/YloC family endoribonuclease [Methylococcus sp. EFPC2]
MTAFANTHRTVGPWDYAWEVRSVNHRYLDLGLRLPESLRYMEGEVRAMVSTRIKRGRVEISLALKSADSEANTLRFDPPRVRALLSSAEQIEALSAKALAPFSALDLLRWPGVLHEAEIDRERLQLDALSVLDETLGKLIDARENEGRQLVDIVRPRLAQIAEHILTVRGRLPDVLQAVRDKLLSRLAETSLKPDVDRLEQEMVYLAQKMDVAEELDRLGAHVEEMLRILNSDEPAGRRLDFLSQEMNREANTLGSKSADLGTTRAAVEIKVLIEQIREQIQNIE